MCGKPLLVNDVGVGITSDGFPSRFPYLKTLIDSGHFRIVLTILTFTRSVKPTRKEEEKVITDYRTIINPYKGKE
jgi:hypothetical protein